MDCCGFSEYSVKWQVSYLVSGQEIYPLKLLIGYFWLYS